jgi:hypothetical protein
MKRRLPVTVLMLCLGSSRGAWASEAAPQIPPANPGPVLDQKLTIGDITISYPAGLEAQAQQVAETCKTVVVPRLERARAIESTFPDARRAATVLTQMLGWPEDEELAAPLLPDALEVTPSNADMRVAAAIAMRRSDLPKRGSERQIRLAAMLAQARGLQDFALQGKADDETWYVLGRITQTEEQTEKAKALLGKLPAGHADGQAALKELEAAGQTEGAVGRAK